MLTKSLNTFVDDSLRFVRITPANNASCAWFFLFFLVRKVVFDFLLLSIMEIGQTLYGIVGVTIVLGYAYNLVVHFAVVFKLEDGNYLRF